MAKEVKETKKVNVFKRVGKGLKKAATSTVEWVNENGVFVMDAIFGAAVATITTVSVVEMKKAAKENRARLAEEAARTKCPGNPGDVYTKSTSSKYVTSEGEVLEDLNETFTKKF